MIKTVTCLIKGILLFSLLIPLQGSAAKPGNAGAYQAGLQFMRAGEYARASVAFRNDIEKNGISYKSLVFLIEAHRVLNTLDECLSYLQFIAENKPDDPMGCYGIGLVYKEKKNYPEALDSFRETLRLAPRFAKGYEALADVFVKMKRPEDAAREIQVQIHLDSKNAAAHYGIAYLHQAQARPKDALKYAEKAIQLDRRFMDAYHLKGMILFQMCQYQKLMDISRTGLTLADESNDAEHRCIFLADMAMAEYFLSHYSQAEILCNESLKLARETGEDREEIRVLQYLANVYRDTNRLPEALESLDEALTISKLTGDRKREGSTKRLLGSVYEFQCDFLKARKSYAEALSVADEMQDINFKALTLWGLGSVCWNLGDYQEALNYLEKANQISLEQNNLLIEQMASGTMGLVHWNLGQYTQALDCLEKALKLARKLGAERWEGVHLGNIAIIYQDLGDYSMALEYYNEAIRLAVKTGSKSEQGRHLGNMAWITFYELGQYDQAAAYYQDAILFSRQCGNQRYEADFLGNLAGLYITMKKYAEAEITINRALRIAKQIRDRRCEATLHLGLGKLYEARGNLDQSLDCYQDALNISREVNEPWVFWESYLGTGSIYEQQGLDDRALASYRKAIDKIESIRDLLKTDELKTAFMEKSFGAYEKIIHLLYRLHTGNPGYGYDKESFHYAERAKANALLDILIQGNILQNLDRIPRDLRESLTENSVFLENKYQTLSDQLGYDQEIQNPDLVSELGRSIEELQNEKARILEKIRRQNPDYDRLIHPRLFSVAEVRNKLLTQNQVLTEYMVCDEAVYVWFLSRVGMDFRRIDLSRKDLDTQMSRISPLFLREERIEKGDHRWANIDTRLLRQLYRSLLEVPGSDFLTHGSELIIVPDGLLCYFPFEMLVTAIDGNRAYFLIEDHPVSYVSSASLLDEELQRKGKSGGDLLAFGNPRLKNSHQKKMDFNDWLYPMKKIFSDRRFESLPSAEMEVRTIAVHFINPAVFTGEMATEKRFKALAGNYGTIHLATHYLTSDVQPMFSKILLAQDGEGDEDGYLQTYEVYNLRLNADLAVLSGCSSGIGRLSRGEGLIGLSRAFLYAGVPSLVVSLWPVEDESTAELMNSFYGHLDRNTSTTRALQQAKMEMIRSGDFRRDPYYWAPFVLIGEGR